MPYQVWITYWCESNTHIEYRYLVSFECKIFYGNIEVTTKKGKINKNSHIEEIRKVIQENVIEVTNNTDTGNIVITNIFLLNKQFKWK